MPNDKPAVSSVISPEVINELIETIEHTNPKTLVYCSKEQVPAIDSLAQQGCEVVHVAHPDQLEKLARFELGVLFDFLEYQNAATGMQSLGRLRNFHCEKIWVAVTTDDDWRFNTMIGLGFKRSRSYSHNGKEISTYQYDLASYNRKREWNNPRYWANPENWGKYRW